MSDWLYYAPITSQVEKEKKRSNRRKGKDMIHWAMVNSFD
jgi:hypothetical protein